MSFTYTPNLKLALPVTGTESGTWGDAVNNQITTLVDQAISGTAPLTSMIDANYTLSNGDGNAANEARYMALLVPSTLTLTAARNVIVPATSKMYTVRNLSTGGFAVTVKTSAGAGISVPNGKTMILYCNGTDVLDGTTYFTSITLGTALPVLSGGTGVTTSTGTGAVVLSTSPTLVTPALGTPASGVVTNLTGTASININGTVGATTPTTGAFTKVIPTGGTATGNGMYLPATNAIAWSNNGVETMRLDSSGNLGLGITPNASYKLKINGGTQILGDAQINGMTVGRGGNDIYLNTAVGYAALSANAGGFQNVAVGYNSMPANTDGAHNVAVGYNTLLSNTTGGTNVAVGENALYTTNGGSYNTAVGAAAMYDNVSGNYNIAIGNSALLQNTTGSGNVMVGARNSSGTYVPVFDPVTESNRLCMGSTAVTNAYVQVAWTVVSDARDKTDFAPVPHGLAFVTKLKPTAYRYKIDREATEGHGPLRYGFKAQDVLALEGDTPVIVDADDLEKLRFNDQAMIAVLVNAIQELKAEFDAYKTARP